MLVPAPRLGRKWGLGLQLVCLASVARSYDGILDGAGQKRTDAAKLPFKPSPLAAYALDGLPSSAQR